MLAILVRELGNSGRELIGRDGVALLDGVGRWCRQ